MPRRLPQGTDPAHVATGLTENQIDRWAGLIADGRDAFPAGLAATDHERLLAAVRQRLRDSLMGLIAKAIAAQLPRPGRPDKEGPDRDRA